MWSTVTASLGPSRHEAAEAPCDVASAAVRPLVDARDRPGPIVVAGPSCLDRLTDRAGRFAKRSAVLVADETVVRLGYVERVLGALDGLDVRVHQVAAGEPSAASVDTAADAVRDAGDAVVVGVGGGSALDTAKQAAVVAGADFGVEHYALAANPLPAGAPVVAIPTTAGTGSEITRTCIVSDRHGRKVWTWGDELWPQLVLLDPVATATMPTHVTAVTGLDAFVHAVEAATGRRRGPATDAPAARATHLIVEHLPGAVADGADLDGRQAMQEAALLAGMAIEAGGTGIAHAIGHGLGTLAHVPHGVAVAVGMAAAIDWNTDGEPAAFAVVAEALGVRVTQLGDVYRRLLAASDFATAVGRVGTLDIDPGELAGEMIAAENQPMFDNSCRRPDDSERHVLATQTLDVWNELARSAT